MCRCAQVSPAPLEDRWVRLLDIFSLSLGVGVDDAVPWGNIRGISTVSREVVDDIHGGVAEWTDVNVVDHGIEDHRTILVMEVNILRRRHRSGGGSGSVGWSTGRSGNNWRQ